MEYTNKKEMKNYFCYATLVHKLKRLKDKF